ncbi:similar to stage IV sporulation protein [Desulfotomaculum arcticum]|uniref:Similar to stage IV sporulation protein n=1 Tax=Desulfotruncus arcticus DSM 17038 TaxID=1121424 RepID=A0A1I2XG99_9FIRM|nr:sporulation protein YqfD [Desulfotruncus arcticus]SFH12554.1 similar to stage IV sporulation protein [Desulfotomaculum arcticum] [Desulfotruncus arcticus DSM 17038]
MLLFKILSYLAGYVTIALPEDCLEKFINMATSRGIFLWGISGVGADRVTLKVRLSGVQPLRHVARMTRCRFTIVEKAGLPFAIVKLRRRKTMLLGALFFVMALYLSSSFVWFINVSGNKSISEQEIKEVARQSGLYPGAFKPAIDGEKLEKIIINRLPNLSWVGVYFDGTRVEVKVVEKVLPPHNNLNAKIDIVAAKDGLIKQILVLQGQPLVQEGDTVKTGQVLISAAIPPPQEEDELDNPEESDREPQEEEQTVKYVQAKGIVKASVWYEGYTEVPLVEKGENYTGHEITKLCIKIGAKEIILMGPRDVPYAKYDTRADGKKITGWRNINIPVEFIKVKYLEKVDYTKTYSKAEAFRMAGQSAIAEIEKDIPSGARITNKHYEEVKIAENENMVRVKALVETIEEIGTEKPHPLS